MKKNQTTLSGDIEEKILSMYAKGMTTSDIEGHIRDIYGISVSDSTISRVTDKILYSQRMARPLRYMLWYSWMPSTPCPQKAIIKKAVYAAIGANGWYSRCTVWVGGNESAKFVELY